MIACSPVSRVFKPGGKFAFQEMSAGEEATIYFPLPWATDPADNFLISSDEMHALLGESGFVAECFEDASDMKLNSPPPIYYSGTTGPIGVRRQFIGKGRQRTTQSSVGKGVVCQGCVPVISQKIILA